MEPETHSISRLERLCFSGKKNNGSGSQSQQSKCVELFPNYPIKNGRLSTDSVLPSSEFLKKVAKSKHLEVNQKASQMIASQKSMYEMIYPSLGQLVTFYALKQDKIRVLMKTDKKLANVKSEVIVPSPNVATCSLLTVEDRFETLFGLTCLHSIQLVLDKTTQFKPEDYEQISVFIKHHCDVQKYLWLVHEEICALVPKWKVEHLTIEKLHHQVAKLLRARAGDQPIFLTPVRVNAEFLRARKDFITKSLDKPLQLQDNKLLHPLLDPEFELQPLPSFDMITFSLGVVEMQAYIKFLKQEVCTESQFQFMEDSTSFARSILAVKSPTGQNFPSQSGASTTVGESSEDKAGDSMSTCISVSAKPLTFLTLKLQEDTPIEPGDLVCLLGFHSIKNRKIENDEVYEPSYKKQFKGLVDSAFLNQNLSLGVCEVKSYQSCIFTYKGNTSEGSSGSPILDKDLRVVGINFGCYHDVQVEGLPKVTSKAGKIKQKPKFTEIHDLTADPSQSIQELCLEHHRNIEAAGVLEVKSKSPNPDHLLQFDVEVKEPGALLHQSSLKNRNLAVCTNHPAFRRWLEEWYQDCIKLASLGKDWEDVDSNSVISVHDVSDVDVLSIPNRQLGAATKPMPNKTNLTIPLRAEKSKATRRNTTLSRVRSKKQRS